MNIQVNDITGDIELENGELPLVSGSEEYAQFLKQKLRTFLGEWFFDIRLGLPYSQQIFVKRLNVPTVEAIFRNEIITTPGVIELQEFDMTLDAATRTLTVSFRALTTEGEVVFDNEEIG